MGILISAGMTMLTAESAIAQSMFGSFSSKSTNTSKNTSRSSSFSQALGAASKYKSTSNKNLNNSASKAAALSKYSQMGGLAAAMKKAPAVPKRSNSWQQSISKGALGSAVSGLAKGTSSVKRPAPAVKNNSERKLVLGGTASKGAVSAAIGSALAGFKNSVNNPVAKQIALPKNKSALGSAVSGMAKNIVSKVKPSAKSTSRNPTSTRPKASAKMLQEALYAGDVANSLKELKEKNAKANSKVPSQLKGFQERSGVSSALSAATGASKSSSLIKKVAPGIEKDKKRKLVLGGAVKKAPSKGTCYMPPVKDGMVGIQMCQNGLLPKNHPDYVAGESSKVSDPKKAKFLNNAIKKSKDQSLKIKPSISVGERINAMFSLSKKSPAKDLNKVTTNESQKGISSAIIGGASQINKVPFKGISQSQASVSESLASLQKGMMASMNLAKVKVADNRKLIDQKKIDHKKLVDAQKAKKTAISDQQMASRKSIISTRSSEMRELASQFRAKTLSRDEYRAKRSASHKRFMSQLKELQAK